jgi:two-component system, chemotaxis family, chemotaxis protein CheY
MIPRILVVDDHEDTLEAMAWFLRKEGFRVTTAVDGLAALREMAASTPDLIILDLQMPGYDGWQVLDLMERDPALRNIPVVVVSGYVADQRTPPDLVALMKPVDFERLRSAVLALVGRGRTPGVPRTMRGRAGLE